MTIRRLAIFISSLAALALAAGALWVTPAEAGRLKAQVYVTQNKIPKKLTEKGLLRFAKSHRAKRLRETNEKDLEKRRWRGQLVVAFNAPVGDTEFSVLFYDVEEGERLVDNMSTFVSDRKQKTFVQKLSLPRPTFKPNRRMKLVVTVKHREVGKTKFEVIGERKRHSGVVNFE